MQTFSKCSKQDKAMMSNKMMSVITPDRGLIHCDICVLFQKKLVLQNS